jgi:hypothetical protein
MGIPYKHDCYGKAIGKRAGENSAMSWRVPPSSARSALVVRINAYNRRGFTMIKWSSR